MDWRCVLLVILIIGFYAGRGVKDFNLNMDKDIYVKLPKKAIETIILDMIGNFENLSGKTEINIEIDSNRLIIRRVSQLGNYNYTKTKYLEYSLANDIIDIKK
ncbi:MAG: hypothetical protein GY830_09870 [Bacteroidetes bacterium]|nr:hypothetical protein [Bacteroidota bacterium]